MQIDHDGMDPLYVQLAAILREQIKSGELPPGRAIPAESRLMQIHELGRDTVRKAVKLLRDEGLVVAVQGRGTFVAQRDHREEVSEPDA